MSDFMLKGAVKAQNFMFEAFDRTRAAVKGGAERGDVVQNVIMIGIFVIACVVLGGFLISSLSQQGEKLSQCISGVNTVTTACSQFNK